MSDIIVPRQGEELDTQSLQRYLDAQLPDGAAGITVEQYAGGHSNLTYLIEIDGRALVLRRPPFGSEVKTAHDMSREYRVLSALAPAYPKAPRPLLFCDDESVLHCQWYIMERVPGVIVRRRFAQTPGAHVCRQASERLIDTLAELHAVDYGAIGLGELGRPTGFTERQVRGWSKRYQNAMTDDAKPGEAVSSWLHDNIPERCDSALIHNDYKFDNVVFADAALAEITGVLDWEMATIGDPWMDLGTALGWWVEAGDPDELLAQRFGPTDEPGMLTRAELVDRYCSTTGRTANHALFYYVFGLFKIAGIGQQIYFRYRTGQTHDARFAEFAPMVRAYLDQAERIIDRRRL